MAHVEKRGPNRWRARYRGPDGRERSRTFERKVDADRWLAGVQVSKSRNEWIDPLLGRVTFADWVERWEATVVDLRVSTLERSGITWSPRWDSNPRPPLYKSGPAGNPSPLNPGNFVSDLRKHPIRATR